MKLTPQKRGCDSENNVPRDRLSELPDNIIIKIISFLPILDAVNTLLLRRFGNLWTFVDTLIFDINGFFRMFKLRALTGTHSDIAKRYKIFVSNVLMLHRNPSLVKFHLLLDSRTFESIKDIDLWLKFAVVREAKEIILRGISNRANPRISVPRYFSSQYLVTLKLNDCRISPHFQVDLGSLKKLILEKVSMCEEAFRRLLYGCPSLEELYVSTPREIKMLGFSASNIRKLSLFLINDQMHSNRYILDFPKLETLELDIVSMPEFINVSSLRNIYLKYLNLPTIHEYDIMLYRKVLEKFEGAEVFRSGWNATQDFLHLLRVTNVDLSLLQIRWKRVVLEMPVLCENCILGVYELLRSLKYLEELTIYTRLMGEAELEFVKHISTFERASTSAKVFFAKLCF